MTTPSAAVAILVFAFLFHPSMAEARGGALAVPCDEPFVMNTIPVNVVVLPYTLPAELKQRSRAAGRLSLLIQHEVAYLVAKYGLQSVFSVQLVESRGHECNVDTVRDQLLGHLPGALDVVLPRHGLVLVWGRVYQAGNELFVQTFVQFLRRGVAEQIQVEVGSQLLSGELSGQGFAGLQRRITTTDLRRVVAASTQALTIYEEPEEGAKHAEKKLGGRRFYYAVAETKRNWMRVESFVPRPSRRFSPDTPYNKVKVVGWVKSTATQEDWSLRALVPELAFVDAIGGYLSLRVTTDPQATGLEPIPWVSAKQRTEAMKSLLSYHRMVADNRVVAKGVLPAAGYEFASAIPMQVAGMLHLLSSELGTKSIREADSCFQQAARLLPADADARNLRVLAGLLLANRGDPSGLSPEQAESMLLDATAVDPTNSVSLRNLASLYELRLQPKEDQPKNWELLVADQRQEIEAKLQIVRKISGSPK